MAIITLNFSNDLNVSLQAGVGDIAYYQTTGTSTITQIGECTAISGNSIICNIDPSTAYPSAGDFIFFAKENIVNTSGIIGYHATVDVEITSSVEKELYAVSSEIFISS
jgi:hypothetical protein